MNFQKLLENSKFMFEWKREPLAFEIGDINYDRLTFKNPLEIPLLSDDSPEVMISVKVGQIWQEHKISETEWLIDDGRTKGLILRGPIDELSKLRKSLEMGLCV